MWPWTGHDEIKWNVWVARSKEDNSRNESCKKLRREKNTSPGESPCSTPSNNVVWWLSTKTLAILWETHNVSSMPGERLPLSSSLTPCSSAAWGSRRNEATRGHGCLNKGPLWWALLRICLDMQHCKDFAGMKANEHKLKKTIDMSNEHVHPPEDSQASLRMLSPPNKVYTHPIKSQPSKKPETKSPS